MQSNKTRILDQRQISRKVTRMAYEIYEHNATEGTIWLAGIDKMGYRLAEMLQAQLRIISPLQVELIKLKLDKQAVTQPEVSLDPKVALEGKAVIVVDDVLNTGKTLLFALFPFMQAGVSKLETAVLVNRSHKQFPVEADYTGYELATTLSDHIEVDLTGDEFVAYLH
ncbi:phosphoribosyltransferase family protein [Penaeicola halotolerans]|uniref:phosphoribosyltransferase family protein n=1 Tax=Penaeicola halotolerans TaxID=2793196 RepID=UPI001CF854A5|nr:phosphoribosyltransferase family protein [Penaeicola halotolerans]